MIPREFIEAGDPRPGAQGKFDPQLPLVNVPYLAQVETNLCWAACIQMVVAAHQRRYPLQCELAGMAFGRADCCGVPMPGGCNQGFNNLANVFQVMQFDCMTQAFPLAAQEIAHQVQAGNPIIYNLLWGGVGAQHTGVISDFRVNAAGIDQVYFLDPDAAFFAAWGRAPHGWVNLDWVLNAYNIPGFPGNWTTTWFDIEQ